MMKNTLKGLDSKLNTFLQAEVGHDGEMCMHAMNYTSFACDPRYSEDIVEIPKNALIDVIVYRTLVCVFTYNGKVLPFTARLEECTNDRKQPLANDSLELIDTFVRFQCESYMICFDTTVNFRFTLITNNSKSEIQWTGACTYLDLTVGDRMRGLDECDRVVITARCITTTPVGFLLDGQMHYLTLVNTYVMVTVNKAGKCWVRLEDGSLTKEAELSYCRSFHEGSYYTVKPRKASQDLFECQSPKYVIDFVGCGYVAFKIYNIHDPNNDEKMWFGSFM
jgi:hypothetical protein